MRIIAGMHKGRRLAEPGTAQLRPTSDKVREALFSILSPHIQGARFLDLCAGTGAVGIEALSRGADHATFVEPDAAALKLLETNLARCGMLQAADVHPCTAERFLRSGASLTRPYDVVFADPPYAQREHGAALLAALGSTSAIADGAVIVLEHATKTEVPQRVGRLEKVRAYRYGDTSLALFSVSPSGEAGS